MGAGSSASSSSLREAPAWASNGLQTLTQLLLLRGCISLGGVCRLGVECSSNLPTADLEAEVFLHVLHNCVEYVQAEGDPDPRSAASVAYADGDGMTRCGLEGSLWWGASGCGGMASH